MQFNRQVEKEENQKRERTLDGYYMYRHRRSTTKILCYLQKCKKYYRLDQKKYTKQNTKKCQQTNLKWGHAMATFATLHGPTVQKPGCFNERDNLETSPDILITVVMKQ